MPTNAYRTSGRPEVTFAIERMMDTAADQLGIDRIKLRRKNLVGPEAHAVPQCGRHALRQRPLRRRIWTAAMELADWKGFHAAQREDAKKRGKLLGLGLANYVESSIGAPQRAAPRSPSGPDGTVDVVIGTQPAGQGHETSFAQVVADLIGVPVEVVRHHYRRHRYRQRRRRHRTPAARCAMPRTVFVESRAVDLIEKGQQDRRDHAWDHARTRSSSRTAAFRRAISNRTFDFLELAAEAAQISLPDALKDGLSVVTAQ